MSADTPTASEPQDEVAPEVILLSVPATGPFGRIARMSTASLALRRGFTLSAVDDLRLAIDEALILLLGHQDHAGSIALRFELQPGALAVQFTPTFDDGPPDLDVDDVERFSELAGPLLSDFSLDTDTGVLRLAKSTGSANPSG